MDIAQALKNFRQSILCHDQSLCDEFIEFLEKPDCFLRANLERHFTASAFVFDPSEKKALLIEHKKLKFWMQPGGHADGDSELYRVAQRNSKKSVR